MSEMDSFFSELASKPLEGDLLDEVQQDQSSELRLSLKNAQLKNPDQQGKIVNLADKLGLPPKAVELNMPAAEQKDRFASVDFDKLETETPGLARFLRRQQNADVAHDDTQNLGYFEGIFKGLGGTASRSFQQGLKGIELSLADAAKNAPYRKVFGYPMGMDASPEIQPFLNVDPKKAEATAQAQIEKDSESLIQSIAKTNEEISALTPEGLDLFQTGVRSGINSLVQQAPGFALTAVSASPAPMLTTMGLQTWGQTYGEAKSKGKTDEQAGRAAFFDATVEVGTELLPAKILADMMGPAKTTFKQFVHFLLNDAVGEQVAEALQDFNQVINGLDDQIKPGMSAGEIADIQLQRQAVAFIATAVAGGAQVSAASGINRITRTKETQAVEQRIDSKLNGSATEQEAIDQIVKLSQDIKLTSRSRQAFGEFVDNLRDQYEYDGNMYLDSDVIQTLQSAENPVIQKAAKQLSEAAVTNGDIVVPMEDFMVDLMPIINEVRPYIRLSPDSMSQSEMENAKPVRDSIIKSMLDEAQKQADLQQESDDIWAEVSDQLVQTGRMNATNARVSASLYPAYITTAVARLRDRGIDITPRELFDRMGFSVLAGQAEGTALNQDTPAFKKWFEGSKVVDNDGAPLKVFHGGYDQIVQFDEGRDAFFTDSAPVANSYSVGTSNAVSTPVFLSLKDPMVFDYQGREWFGNEKDISAAREAGHDGVIFKNVIDQGNYRGNSASESPSTVFVAFAPNQIKSAVGNKGTFDPNDPNILHQLGERGSIQFLDNERIIRLTEASDLTTFLHESAHLFLDMERSLAAAFGQSEDHIAIAEWLGVKSIADIDPSTKQGIAAQEKFAEAFEQYLFEGKAPSPGLRESFRAFKRWLMEVYKHLIQGEQIGDKPVLNDNIRAVFDRLLAVDEEIKAQEAQMQFEVADTPEEAKPTERAKESLEQKVLSELRRKTEKWWKDELRATAESVKQDLANDPLYKAEAYLKENNVDRQAVKDMLGITKIPSRMNGLTATEGGMAPDEVAALFNMEPAELFGKISESPTINQAAQIEAERRMIETHGDILKDGTLEREARDAVHNNDRARQLLVELRALNKKAGRAVTIDRNTLREAAKDTVSKLTVTQLMKAVERYHRAEVKSAVQAKQLENEKDFAGAARAKTQQNLNFHLYREARRARDQVERYRKHLADVQRRKYDPKTVQPEYIQHLKRYVAAFDFRRHANEMQRKEALLRVASWVKSQVTTDGGYVPQIIDPQLDVILEAEKDGRLDQVSLKYYKDMTVNEMQAVYDMARHLRFIGGKLSEAEAASRRAYHESVASAVLETFKGKKRPQDKTTADAVSRAWQGYASQVLLHADFQLRRLDGFKDLGPVYRAVKGKIDIALSEKLVPMQEKAGDEMSALYAKHYTPDELKGFHKSIKANGHEMTRWELISLGLNWGNESSREAVVAQIREGKPIFQDQQEVEGVLESLDKRDWDFIQDVWDYISTYKEEMGRIDRVLTGTSPRWVEPSVVQTKHGTYRGGYYPLKYDSRDSMRVSEEEIKQMFESVGAGRFAKAHTPDGMLKERVGSGGRPIRMDMMVFHQHVNQAIQYISLAEPVAEVQSLFNSKSFRGAMENTGNVEVLKALDAWLKDVAAGEIVSGDVVSKALRHVRTGFSASKLGYNVGTMLMQPLGVIQSIPVVGAKNMLKGITTVMSQPTGKDGPIAHVMELSPFMRERGITFNKDIRDTLELLNSDPTQKHFLPQWFRKHLFTGIVFFQRYVDTATWLAAYEQGKAQNPDWSEKDLITYSDGAVRRSQASGVFADRTPIERGTISSNIRQAEFVRIWSTLGSYFFAKGNLAVELTQRTDFKNPQEIGKYAVNMVLLFSVEALLTAALRGTIPDDEEDWTWFALNETAKSALGSFPFIREVSSEMSGFRGGSTLSGFYESIGRVITQLGQGEIDMALAKSLNNVGGVIFKYPSSAINRVADSIVKQSEGEDIGPVDYMIYREKD